MVAESCTIAGDFLTYSIAIPAIETINRVTFGYLKDVSKYAGLCDVGHAPHGAQAHIYPGTFFKS